MTELAMPDTTPEGARALYSKCYEDARYGMSTHLRSIAEPLLKAEIERVARGVDHETDINYCDVACGRGEMIDYVASLEGGAYAWGFEIVPALARDIEVVLVETMLELYAVDKSQHVVSCFDVLEHLAEVDMIAAITELWRITHTTLIIAVSCVAAKDTFGDGVQLHPTQQQPSWWRDRIQEVCLVPPELVHKKAGKTSIDHGKLINNYVAATFVVRRVGE